MRAALERRLNTTWYGEAPPGVLLTLMERLYRYSSARARSRSLANHARDLVAKPIVVVGNLTAGGSGKTPLVISLCELARECGLRAAVISRGYGRSGKGHIVVSRQHTAKDVGDEPLLIARRTGVPVVVDASRERAARALFEDNVDIIISDDGLQRLSLPRMLEFCLVDGQRGFGNGHLLPAGPLREPVSRLQSVDFVVHHLADEMAASDMGDYRMHLKAGPLHQLDGDETRSLDEVKEDAAPIFAVAGIARPGRFFEMLTAMGLHAGTRAFPDHHRYQKSDFDNVPPGSMILMTEKDAVKCQGMGLSNAWYVPVDAVLHDSFKKAIMQRFRELVPEPECEPIFESGSDTRTEPGAPDG